MHAVSEFEVRIRARTKTLSGIQTLVRMIRTHAFYHESQLHLFPIENPLSYFEAKTQVLLRQQIRSRLVGMAAVQQNVVRLVCGQTQFKSNLRT